MANMLLKAREIYQFGKFQLDPAARTLWRDTEVVTLNRRAFDVLLYLVRNPGKLISRDELLKSVWPDAFVDENSLSQSISALRRALDEKPGEPSYIATVPGRGYQLIISVQTVVLDSTTGTGTEEPAVPEAQSRVRPQVLVGIQTVNEHTHTLVEESVHPFRRRWLSGRIAVGWVVALAGITAIVVGWRLMHPPTYGHAEAVIADLDNETGDADFDHSLNRMLQIDLQQSPYFAVVGEGRKRDTLNRMRQPVDERITAPLAREICQRLNGQLYLTPAIAKIGDRYLVSLEANDCADGHALGAGRKEVSSKSEVLPALSGLTQQVRRDAGESRASIQQFNRPLFNSYTASLEALKAYSEATRLAYAGKFAESIALYQRAIDLDQKFAAAYADMAGAYFNMGDELHDREAASKAYELRDSVNDYERFFIEYGYHASVTGDLHAQLNTLRQWAGTYSNDSIPIAALVNIETQIGEFANSAAYADRALELQRSSNIHNSTTYDIAARAYHHANMPDKLRAVYTEALQANADSQGLHATMLEFAVENGDATGLEREIVWSRGKPDECRILLIAALAAVAAGQVRRADALFAEADSAARRDKLEDILADYNAFHARMLVELGFTDEAKSLIEQPMNGEASADRLFAEAEIGDAAKALAEAQRQETAAPTDVLTGTEFTPSVRAAIALRQGKPGDAIAQLKADAPYELRNPTVPYLRGQAYLAIHQGPQAAAEFAKIADKPWLADPPSPLIALASLGLARAYALEGNSASCQNEYQKFFTLWKDADADLPILREAHSEYERIR
jgi:eukaryotic-like serine/threonine-protein kinase